ncbi:MAG: hypothetical protein ACYDB6_07210 [Candidatus Limnocylindrales bacterium]
MPPVVIENPILNSPFDEPTRHLRFDEDGITSDIADGRRRSTYFIPIAKPRTKGGTRLSLPDDWVGERMTDNDFINRVRDQVTAWRRARYPGITAVTHDLLAYWQAPDREKPLFCQIEALETAIFLAEVAGNRQPWIENNLRENSQARNPGLPDRAHDGDPIGQDGGRGDAHRLAGAQQAVGPARRGFASGQSGSVNRRAAVPRDQVRPSIS